MSRQVWKFPLDEPGHGQQVAMPAGATIVHVDTQHDRWCVWAEVDPDAPTVVRRFHVAGTGQPIPPSARHVGTALTSSGFLVWHVYEIDQGDDL